MPPIAQAADLAALEQQDYNTLLPAISPYAALERSAARFGPRDALRYLHSGAPDAPFDRWTYTALLARVRQAANAFRRLGLGPDQSVAFLLPSLPQAYFTLLGAETAGRACPINYLLQPAHIAELLQAAHCHILVALGPDPRLDIWSKVADIRAHCPQLAHVLTVGQGVPGHARLEDLMDAERGDALDFAPPARRDQIAACFHTGGTTATPKLAQHTQGNQVHAAWGAALLYAMDERDVIVNGFPLFHVAGAFVYGLSALMAGATVVLPTLLGMRDALLVRHYWQMVQRHRVTLLAGVPTVMAALMEVPVGDADIGSVRCMLTGGSPLPTELAQQFEQRFGLPVRNILGMTECAGVISIVPFHAPRVPGSCGLPLPFTRVRVVRMAHEQPLPDQPCAPGETGMVLVQGPHVSPGYTDPARNAGTFTPDGWLISGDLGYLSENGELHLNGRAKDVIIRSSHNIDPACIEEALLQHPAVQMAAAVGQPDEYAGELPAAFVCLRPGQHATPDELLAFAAPRIPERPAVPKVVTVLDSLPLTPIGKIFKPALRRLAIAQVLQDRVAQHCTAGAMPAVQVEEAGARVTVLWDCGAATGDTLAAQHAALRSLMAPFALDYRITPALPDAA